MIEACQQLVNFLDSNGMFKSSKALKEEMELQSRNNLSRNQPNQKLLEIINVALKDKEQIERKQKHSQQIHHQIHQPHQQANPQLYTQEETESIMEKLMNRLVASPNLLEDEKLNAKIERFFENQTFQKMVEGTDVFQDISNLSFQNSYLNKNKQENQNKTHTSNSFEIDQAAPRFGGINDNNNVLKDYVNDKQQENFATPKNSNQNPQQRVQDIDELFITEEDQQPSNIKQDGLNSGDKKVSHNSKKQFKSTNNNNNNSNNNNNNNNQDIEIISNDGKMPSMIRADQADQSSDFLQNSQSILLDQLEEMKQHVDEYVDDEDPGFVLYEVGEREFSRVSKQLADKYGFPDRAINYHKKREQKNVIPNIDKDGNEEDSAILLQQLQNKNSSKNQNNNNKKQDDATEDNKQIQQQQQQDQNKNNNDNDNDTENKIAAPEGERKPKPKGYIYLPDHLKHPQSQDEFYPVEYDKVIYDCFNLKVIYDRERTGFEETKDFPIVINSIIGGRYQVLEYLGSAAFSKAIQCLDLVTNQMLCMKIIENNKDYFDQSIDEIKLLKYINFNGDVDDKNVLRLYDYFYHKEHLFIVTELLKDNLYEFYKYNREQESEPYFTLGKLQRITKQILQGLEYIHSLHLIHCDLKPENILMKSYSQVKVKIIDFGSSCFIHDHLSSYVQSRSYRAPEVIIGCKYDFKIDMWSLGCILAELWTGSVLFQNDSVQGLLSRVMGIIGSFPEWMFKEGRLVHNFFTREKLLYQEVFEDGEYSQNFNETSDLGGQKKRNKTGRIQILVPKKSNLRGRLKTDDVLFIDFIKQLLHIDYTKRPTAKEALNHPWLTQSKYPDGL